MVFEFLKSLVKSTPAQKVRAIFEAAIFEHWTNASFLDDQLQQLFEKKVFDDPAAVAELASRADVVPVNQALNQVSPAIRAAALAGLVVSTEGLSDEARPFVVSAFQRALLLEPALLQTLPEAAKTLGAKLLSDAGHGLPEATAWRSPWESAPKKKKAAKVDPPALPAWPEKFHVDDPSLVLNVEGDAMGDAQALAAWNDRQYGGKRWLYPLARMSDAAALPIWNTVSPDEVWIYGEELAMLVPRFGLPGLEASLKFLQAHPGGIAAAARLESPRVAPMMAVALGSRAAVRVIARAWFDRFAEAGAVGLVPDALGMDRGAAGRAIEALRHLRRTSVDEFNRGLARFPQPVRDAIDEVLLRGAELPTKKPALPAFADPRALPRPVTPDGTSLQGEALADLVRLLKLTPLDGAPWLADMSAAFTEASLVTFSRALFDAWMSGGCPPKEKWALQALAHFPDDAVARTLAEMAAELAPKGLSARAQEMTEVLAAMQTRTSLKLVHQLSRKVRSKAFRTRAELVFTTPAEKMGLTQDELAERLVPDFGLTPQGVLPVEPRIQLVLEGVKAKLVDAGGAVVKALPEVKDEELAAQLAELKKKGTALMREVIDRLERRMANGRTMSLEHFTEVYAMHGLTRRVAERLVWGVYGAKLEATFGFTEDGFIDERGGPFIASNATGAIGVVHPLDLSPAAEAAWKQRLGDDQPFEQLARRATHLANPEALRLALRGYVNRSLPPGALIGLEKLGWERGPMVGGGCYVSYVRQWPTGVVEVSFAPGIYLGDPRMHGQQVIEACEVNLREPSPAKVLSETEHDLAGLF